ncbi:MAG: HEPN domain-containing protein [Candidatus Caldarchaeum sp.]|nr:HEPN domain-containing protein [Candidatus Caldarchaeum sp.]
MKSREIAEDYLYRAKRCLKEAGIALADEDDPAVVRRSQEALELAVKALLRHHAIEYPREHDVSDALQNLRGKVMHRLEEMLPQIAALMSELAKLRGQPCMDTR